MKLGLALLAAGALAAPSFQKRVKPMEEADFPTLHKAVRDAWDQGKYGHCMEKLQDCIALVTTKRREAILAAFPAAPEGYTVQPERDQNAAAQQNRMLSALAIGIGNVIERKYNEEGGRGQISITLTADSPMVQMFSMWVSNPAMLDANSELIEYNEHKAVLKKNGNNGHQLQILLHGKHICDVTVRSMDEDSLFKFMDQAAVDRLAAALDT